MDQDASEELVVGDLILLEVLQGARSPKHVGEIEALLRQYQVVELFGDAMAVQAARNFRTLRSLGIRIRKTVGLIIGTCCIVHDHTLLQTDRDFDPMARHLGLKLA